MLAMSSLMMPVPAMLGASQLVHKPPEAKLLAIHSHSQAHSQATPQHNINYQQPNHMSQHQHQPPHHHQQQQQQQLQQQSKPGMSSQAALRVICELIKWKYLICFLSHILINDIVGCQGNSREKLLFLSSFLLEKAFLNPPVNSHDT